MVEDHVKRRSFLVCTTPRSGSGFLCDTLWRTGYFGKPDEYFCDKGYHPEYATDGDRRDLSGYIGKVHALSAGRNGVLGAKIMRDHFVHLLDLYRSAHTGETFSDLSIAGIIFANPRFIRLSRQNKLHQAVSLYRRRVTGVFHRRSDVAQGNACPEPAIDELEVLIRWLEDQDSEWTSFFRNNGIEPLEIRYEQIRDDINAVVTRISDFLDVDLPRAFPMPESDYRPISDTLTETWIAAFENERGPYKCE